LKNRIDDLAIFGTKPAFSEKLYVGRPNPCNFQHLIERITDIFNRCWFTNNGIYVQELERKIAEMIGVKHCIAMCNGTVALEIAIRAVRLSGEVIVPSFTFIATVHALQWQKITPVFCDIDPDTHNIDPVQIEQIITPRTTGIIGVHTWGRACDVDVLEALSEKHNLKLLFDASHAFHCSYKGKMIGQFGNAEIFSFHATKFFNTFEGGAVTTNDDDLAKKIRLMKNFGFSGYDNVVSIGTNGKLNEVSAAMGITLMENLNEFIKGNLGNYNQYHRELDNIPGIRLIEYDESEKCNYQYIVLEIDEKVTQINRDQLIEILHAENVLARRYFYPGCHKMEPYRSFFPNAGLLLPETEQLVKNVMTLPTGMAIGKSDIIQICHILRFAVKHGSDLNDRMRLVKKNKNQQGSHAE